jgi:hypothetical protein
LARFRLGQLSTSRPSEIFSFPLRADRA